ncbi:MAG: cobalamin-dependent protein, partial [Elusimicrobia bacterium]|nr:cobalamin-dependent protein [Elusimicrobiota bacterium]
ARALTGFDRERLGRLFDRSARELGLLPALREVWVPALAEVGAKAHEQAGLWIAVEHFASAFLRERVLAALGRRRVPGRPRLALTSPAGDRHELGMLIAAAELESRGVPVLYLGPDLPLDALLAALESARPDALALALTADLPRREARRLFESLRSRRPGLRVYACGRASVPHCNLVRELGAVFLGTDLDRGAQRLAADLAGGRR